MPPADSGMQDNLRSRQPLVTLNLTVESMRHQVVHALTQHEADLSKEIREAVDEAVADPDLIWKIRQQARQQVEQVLAQSIDRAIQKAFWEDDLRAALKALYDAWPQEAGMPASAFLEQMKLEGLIHD